MRRFVGESVGKLIVFASIAVYLFSCIQLISAQQLSGDVVNENIEESLQENIQKLESAEEKLQDFEGKVDKIQDTEETWDYLREEWAKIFLKNKYIAAADSFFSKISFFFRILFGMDYSFSILLAAVIILWLWIVINLSLIIESYGILKGWQAYAAGVAIGIVLSQAKIIIGIVNFAGKIIFSAEYWHVRAIIIVIAVFIISFVQVLVNSLSKYIKEMKKKKLEHEAEIAQKQIKTFAEEFSKASEGI